MSAYLIVKTLHILSSVLLVGTGFGSAYDLFFTHRSGSTDSIAVVSRLVVRADGWFTTPAMICSRCLDYGWRKKRSRRVKFCQPITGFMLAIGRF